MKVAAIAFALAVTACASSAPSTKSPAFPVSATSATGDMLSRSIKTRLTTHMEVCFGADGWAAARVIERSGNAMFDRAVLADGERWEKGDTQTPCRRVSVTYQPE